MNVPPLSEAILLGIGAVRETRAFYISSDGDPLCGCAIGTACYAVGKQKELHAHYTDYSKYLSELWPWTAVLGKSGDPIYREISYRHSCGESRESIAAWVATIEPVELESPALSPVAQGQEVGA